MFITLDLLAGTSGIAKCSITAFKERERIGRNTAASAFRELETADLIRAVERATGA